MLDRLEVYVEGELTEADLVATSPYPQLKRMSERHHGVARMIAAGCSNEEAARTYGYSGQMITVLRANPAFMELVGLYKDKIEGEFLDFHKRLATLAADAASLVQDRLETEPEKVSTGQLLEILKVGADRSGYGPKTTVEHDIGSNLAARLEAARARAKSAMIEGTAVDVTPGGQSL